MHLSQLEGGSRRSQSQPGSELLDEAPLSLRARSFQDLFGSALPRTEASSAPPRTAAVAVPEVPSDEASDDDDDDADAKSIEAEESPRAEGSRRG
mmetsp:Transcript_59870/g.195428  ORF Transcript_59870/g.195428 Transcript_59870/m.195428 type:complete len:95 (+) Transcript_59870:2388-2672(+)